MNNSEYILLFTSNSHIKYSYLRVYCGIEKNIVKYNYIQNEGIEGVSRYCWLFFNNI